MKDQIINNLVAVLNALNNVTVSGKKNLGNLSGSISFIEETVEMLQKCEVTAPDDTPVFEQDS